MRVVLAVVAIGVLSLGVLLVRWGGRSEEPAVPGTRVVEAQGQERAVLAVPPERSVPAERVAVDAPAVEVTFAGREKDVRPVFRGTMLRRAAVATGPAGDGRIEGQLRGSLGDWTEWYVYACPVGPWSEPVASLRADVDPVSGAFVLEDVWTGSVQVGAYHSVLGRAAQAEVEVWPNQLTWVDLAYFGPDPNRSIGLVNPLHESDGPFFVHARAGEEVVEGVLVGNGLYLFPDLSQETYDVFYVRDGVESLIAEDVARGTSTQFYRGLLDIGD